ncbi:MAG: SpoIIE family protein phosphatase [Terracidiphilus sp.]
MRTRVVLAAILVLLSALTTRAQQNVELGQGTVALTGPWKFHPGDSPWVDGNFAWAQSSLDDSSWASMELGSPSGSIDPQFAGISFIPGWTLRGYPNLRGFAWYRLRVHVSSSSRPLWISMPVNVDDAYQLFANGRYLGQFGSFTRHGVLPIYAKTAIFPLPASPGSDFEIAVRFFMMDYSPLRWPDAGGMHAPPVLGLRSAIFTFRSMESSQLLKAELGGVLAGLLDLMALPFVLWLATVNRRERLWSWLACAIACQFLGQLANSSALMVPGVPMWVGEIVALGMLANLTGLCWVQVWLCWFDLPSRSWIGPTAYILTAANIFASVTLTSASAGFTFASHSVLRACNGASDLLTIAIGILLLALLVLGYRKDGATALLATLPILMQVFSSLYIPLLVLFQFSNEIFFHGLGLQCFQISAILMLLCVGALVLRRFLSSREQEAAKKAGIERDLEEARLLQQAVLTPGTSSFAGVQLNAVYLPAQQVGGDFFQTHAFPNGSVLIVIGDVSGKGLPAAMTVSLLIGALRIAARESSRPAEILLALNAALQVGKHSGFTTCLILRLDPSGQLTAANAGHIPPYLDGRELNLNNGLPLGLTSDPDYPETSLDLPPAAHLTLITDGVIEARDLSGKLFGFDRTAAICNQSAESIAQAAQAFGQEDDITVLTLAFAPAEVLHA